MLNKQGWARGGVRVKFGNLERTNFLNAPKWILGTFNHLRKQNDCIIKNFGAAGVAEAIKCPNDIFKTVENPFDEHRQQLL